MTTPITFFEHILHILFVGSEPKMIGINAGPNVTRMTNFQSFRNLAFMPFIGKPMGSHHHVIKPNSPISFLLPFSPKPTGWSFFYRSPKSLPWSSLTESRSTRFTSYSRFSYNRFFAIETLFQWIRVSFHKDIIAEVA